MKPLWPALTLVGVCVIAVCELGSAGSTDRPGQQGKKASLTLKANPMMSFTPAKIRFVAELKGGSNDTQELYCPTIEWDWNDDTTSEVTVDCEPYLAGKTQITRRFTTEHEYKFPGAYRVQIRLKRKNRVIISGSVLIQVSQGVR